MDFLDDEFDEILNIFLAESEEIISRINTNLLDLEKNQQDEEIILSLFRDAHSLKGAARMIGFTNIQDIAHKIEDILGIAKDDKTGINPQMIEVLYKTVDFLDDYIKKAVEHKQETDSEEVAKQLDILENIDNYKNNTTVAISAPMVNSNLLSDNIAGINISVSKCLVLLMQLEFGSNLKLIKELYATTKNLYIEFKKINSFEIKQELSNINLKLDAVIHAETDLESNEIEELIQKFNSIIDNLIMACEINNIEVVDYYSNAMDTMSEINKKTNQEQQDLEQDSENTVESESSEETINKQEQDINSMLQNLELTEDAIDDFDSDDTEQNVLPKNEAKKEQNSSENFLSLEDSLTNIQFIKEKIDEIKNNKTSAKKIVEILDKYKKEIGNKQVQEILQKISGILEFATQNNIEFQDDNLVSLSQGIEFCESILKSDGSFVDSTVILQQLEIVQQLMDIQYSNIETPGLAKLKDKQLSTNNKPIDVIKTAIDTGEIKTLRVESSKLDMLVNQVGELIVAKMKNKKHLHEISEINSKLEDWQRNLTKIVSHLKYYEKKYFNTTESEKNPVAILLKQLLNLQIENNSKVSATVSGVSTLEKMIQEDDMKMGTIVADLEQMVKNVRVLPVATVFHMFGRMVRDIANEKHKKIELDIVGSETSTDKKIIEEIKTPLIHIIRNAVDHGIETPEERIALGKPPVGRITLRAKTIDNEIIIEVEDDGRGINLERIKERAIHKGFLTREEVEAMPDEQIINIIFAPGFSTGDTITDISGRGIGLDVVQTKIAQLNGKIKVISEVNKGSCLRIELPTTMSTVKAFLVKTSEQSFAIPLSAISGIAWIDKNDINKNGDSKTFKYEDSIISLYHLSDILLLPKKNIQKDKSTILILGKDSKFFGVEVDTIIGEQDILHKTLSAPLYRVKNVSGVTTLDTGEICLILNMADLMKTVSKKTFLKAKKPVEHIPILKKPTKNYNILIVDDSVTTRTLEKNILERVGYKVTIATNPVQAESELKRLRFDLIISDVEMPEMNGFEFLQKLKTDDMYFDIPFIFVSSIIRDENIQKAKELGAIDYITKFGFRQNTFLDTVAKAVEKNQD